MFIEADCFSKIKFSTDSGGSHSLDMSQVQSGESNARGDNPLSKTRKTGRRQARKKGVQGDELPLLQVNSSPIQRSESQSSLLSAQSAGSYGRAVSAFSKSTESAVEINKRACMAASRGQAQLACAHSARISSVHGKKCFSISIYTIFIM